MRIGNASSVKLLVNIDLTNRDSKLKVKHFVFIYEVIQLLIHPTNYMRPNITFIINNLL